jgi:hypothetical protein
VSSSSGDDLTTIELLVLYEAGGDNDTGNAYGAVQLYAVFEREEELLDATQSALLRLFDLGLVQFVEAVPDVGYTAKRDDLPALSRDQLLKEFARDRVSTISETKVFYDPTPTGRAVLSSIPAERIPRVSGRVLRPWLEK